MSFNRRNLLGGLAATTAFSGYALRARAQEEGAEESYLNEVEGYGPLVEDPYGMFDLPAGFSYRVISQAGETMSDGLLTPYKADGMGCIPLDGSRVALIRNHELKLTDYNYGPAGYGRRLADKIDRSRAYDVADDGHPLPGGTTTMIYDVRTGRLESQYLSLIGTGINCAGGVTPWNSWLSCEEWVLDADRGTKKDHGWIFDVPAAQKGLAEPIPLKALGRFRHEAAAVDPRNGIIYLTEDAADHTGLIYRFLPNDRMDPKKGGKLQALGFKDAPSGGDCRNWEEVVWKQGDWKETVWIDLDGIDSPNEDLRFRAHRSGAAIAGRAEGIHMGANAFFIACTSSGPGNMGQVLRYVPSAHEGKPGEKDAPGKIQLFVESTNNRVFDYGDNLTVAPWGHVLVCEDRYSDTDRNHLKGVTPEGKIYTIGRNVFTGNAELAGVCFSPDGSTLFVNIYWPGMTLAITGPWKRFSDARVA